VKITVELKGYLDQYAPSDDATFPYDMPEGATVQDVMTRLHIPDDLTSAIVIGGEAGEPAQRLSEGDRLTLIPPLAGG
jgi:molybdopterin converting factor small subunit